MKKITLLLSTMMLLTVACATTNTLVTTNGVNDLTAKIDEFEGRQVGKYAKYDSTIDFSNNGTGSAYMSNVKVQYANGTNENTSALRFVAAVKGNVSSFNEVELPGTYGFHVSYQKDNGIENFMYDVDYVYHSIGATVDDVTTYYTNEYSAYYTSENREDIASWLGEENVNEYNLFIAVKLDNIPSSYVDGLITVQPYLKLNDSEEVVTSKDLRYTTPEDVKNSYNSYFISNEKSLTKMETNDGNVFNVELNLVEGETISLLDKNNLEVKSFTATKSGVHSFTYNQENNELNVTEPIVLTSKALYKEFNDEANVDLKGWNYELNSAVTGSVTPVNGNALRYNVTSSPATDCWHVKFHRGMFFENGVTYTLRYHVNVISTTSEENPEVAMHVDGTDATIARINKEGASIVEKTFVGGGADKYITLELGKVGTSFVLDVNKVEVVKHNYEYVDVTNDNYSFVDNVTATFWDGSQGNIDVQDKQATYNITTPRPSNVGGIWVNKFGIIADHNLQANKTYRISIDLYAEKALNKFEILYGDKIGNDDAENNIGGGLWEQSIGEKQTQTYSCTFTPNRDIENFKVTIHLGECLEVNSFTASNFKVEVIEDNPTNEITSFCPTQLAASDEENSNSSLSYNNGVYTYNIERFGQADWHTKLGIYNVELEANKIYTFEFDASSSSGVEALFMVHRMADVWETPVYQNIAFNAETQTYSFTTELLTEAMTIELLWQFGGENKVGPADFNISNIRIYSQYYN